VAFADSGQISVISNTSGICCFCFTVIPIKGTNNGGEATIIISCLGIFKLAILADKTKLKYDNILIIAGDLGLTGQIHVLYTTYSLFLSFCSHLFL